MRRGLLLSLAIVALTSAVASGQPASKPVSAIRFATFNASLSRESPSRLVRDLATTENVQARNVAEIIQIVRPDVLLINEFDHDPQGRGAELFQQNYLGVSQYGAKPIIYPHVFTAEVNTGVSTGVDLDNDGRAQTVPGTRGYGNDAIGFGQFPGQYGMVVYSMFPIDRKDVRQFHRLLWKDMPGARLPRKPDGAPWYSPEALGVLRLSSKSHWDVPIRIGDRTVHVLASHPTPPAFDGPEHRNVNRNRDEIRLWADYLTGGETAGYLRRALPPGAAIDPPETFVLMGDMNADPIDGASAQGAIDQLLKHPKVNAASLPRSAGAVEAARVQGEANARHKGESALDTADFADTSAGNLRVDYILPSRDLTIAGSGVFWPVEGDPLGRLVRMTPEVASSDHRLVYLDVARP